MGAQTLYTRYAYDDHGRLVKIWGDVPQPTWVEYDDYGQRSKLHTYRGDGALGTWPDTPGAGDITEWRYHDATGLLEHKLYADGTSVDYTYTDYNQLDIRTWARGVTSDYDYNPATGELTTITYSDGTPGVGFTYDRLGRTATVTDATGTHTMGYNIYGALASDAIAGSFYTDTITVAPQHEDETGTIPGRFNGLQVTHGTTGVYSANYEYDDYGRISRVTGPGLPAYGAAYTYFDLSDGTSVIRVLPTVLDVKFMTDPTTTLARGSRRYEGTRDLVNRIENHWDPDGTATLISKYDYRDAAEWTDSYAAGADEIGRRTDVAYSGVAFGSSVSQDFGYNDRNELTSSTRAGSSWTYDYDNIGNRTSCTVNAGTPLTTTYTTSELNQYRRLQSAQPELA
ncbi:MAG: hypothetical protein MI741_09545, partial [Rhodospirillales bacterium]|nr:hypothetical protein [Rhodospirillales bacterium]